MALKSDPKRSESTNLFEQKHFWQPVKNVLNIHAYACISIYVCTREHLNNSKT